MTTSSVELRVDCDLQLDIDGVTAVVVSDGRHLTLRTDDAPRLLARAVATTPEDLGTRTLRRTLGTIARELDVAGLSAGVIDDGGPLLELGRDCDSRAGRVLFGSALVRPRLRPLARGLRLVASNDLRRWWERRNHR